jgi:hypothetical protein
MQKQGQTPGAQAWEDRYWDAEPEEARGHKSHLTDPEWWGHCHAYAAAACLEPEPTTDRIKLGVSFNVGEQKGILAAAYNEVFESDPPLWGSNNSHDMATREFHVFLEESLRNLRKALMIDLDPWEAVYWHPCFKYRAHMETPDLREPNVIDLTTCLWYRDYHGNPNDVTGTEPGTQIDPEITYQLTFGPNGNPVDDPMEHRWLMYLDKPDWCVRPLPPPGSGCDDVRLTYAREIAAE